MRRFIITNPNLSAGRPGDLVDADQLGMDDDQLDVWVEAGFAAEVEEGDEPEVATNDYDPDYDPADHNAPDVVDYMARHPQQADAIIAAETAGKNRSTIVGDD